MIQQLRALLDLHLYVFTIKIGSRMLFCSFVVDVDIGDVFQGPLALSQHGQCRLRGFMFAETGP